MAEHQTVLVYGPNTPADDVEVHAHMIYEPDNQDASLVFVMPDGGTSTEGFSRIKSQESSDAYGDLHNFPVNKWMHAMIGEIFQIHFSDPPLTDFPAAQTNVESGILVIGGTPA
jgi:hypothetical protein